MCQRNSTCVQGPAVAVPAGGWSEMQILGPHVALEAQKRWGPGVVQASVLERVLPRGAVAHPSLRTSGPVWALPCKIA